MAKKNNGLKRVFDVAKPGKTGPDATARPLIVGHKIMVEDPMVKSAAAPTPTAPLVEGAEEPVGVKTDEASNVAPHEAKTVTPPSEVENNEEKTPDKTPEEPKEPAVPEPIDEEDSKKEEESTETTTPAVPVVSDSLPDEEKPKEVKDDKAIEAEKAQEEAIQKLIENKQYVVHVGEAKHRRNAHKTILILILVLLLAVIGADLAIDGGLIKTSFKPPIDLIKN